MPENQNPDNAETSGGDAAPARLDDSELAAGSSENPEPANSGGKPSDDDKPPSNKTLLREVHWLDLINAGVGVAMLLVAMAAYRVASDTGDVKNAVRNLSDLATQTKRQADFTKGQLDQVRREADAATGQLNEMRNKLVRSKRPPALLRDSCKRCSMNSVPLSA